MFGQPEVNLASAGSVTKILRVSQEPGSTRGKGSESDGFAFRSARRHNEGLETDAEQAFLYLGVAFLFLVVFAQIWHAAVDRQQTWVWWASGIALGAAILALFAVFEKRRNDVLKLVDEIKRWD